MEPGPPNCSVGQRFTIPSIYGRYKRVQNRGSVKMLKTRQKYLRICGISLQGATGERCRVFVVMADSCSRSACDEDRRNAGKLAQASCKCSAAAITVFVISVIVVITISHTY